MWPMSLLLELKVVYNVVPAKHICSSLFDKQNDTVWGVIFWFYIEEKNQILNRMLMFI